MREPAGDGIPDVVTCRVWKLARRPYSRWLAGPVSVRELEEAYLADALFDGHDDDPEVGCRRLADEARSKGHTGCDTLVDHPAAAADRGHHLDRTHSTAGDSKPASAGRPPSIRDDHDHTAGACRLTAAVTYPCSSPR